MCNCGSTTFLSQSYTRTLKQAQTLAVDCDIELNQLKSWLAILKCLKSSGLYKNVGLNITEINRLTGIIQSAINYPDNYCYYKERFENFQNNILPLIISNVPECI